MTTLLYNINELLQIREQNVLKVAGTEMATLPTLKTAIWLLKMIPLQLLEK